MDRNKIQQQIDELRKQQLSSNSQDRIFALESQLEETNRILKEVQNQNKDIISTIQPEIPQTEQKSNLGVWVVIILVIAGIALLLYKKYKR